MEVFDDANVVVRTALIRGGAIQGRVIPNILLGIMELTLFQTREWWQHEFRVSVTMFIQDSRTGACKKNFLATAFLCAGEIFLNIQVMFPNGRISDSIQAGGYESV